jgi:thioredoxin-related protein
MYRILIIITLIISALSAPAQTDTSLLYLRFPIVPSFKLTRIPDSTYFSKEDLKKKRATMIMMFDPHCEHCQHFVRELAADMDEFKKVQIIMVSPHPYSDLKQFYDDYGLSAYPNIIMGSDPSYFLGTFYKVRTFPSIFLYNKKGELVKPFIGAVTVGDIAKEL